MKKIREKFIKIEEAKNLLKPASDYSIKDDQEDDIKSSKKDNKKTKAKKVDIKEKNPSKKEVKPKLIIKAYNPDLDKGLTEQEILDRKKAGLTNFVVSKSNKKLVTIILKNLFSFFNILMFVMVGLLIWAKAPFSNYFFLFAVIANFFIYIVQEIKAKRIIDKLSLKTKSKLVAVRDDEDVEISSDDIVYNDILKLHVGATIPADLILRSDEPIEVNESILTGEADSCIKKKGDLLYSGSFITSGSCIAQAVVVGKNTYIEKLSSVAKKQSRAKSQIINSINLLIKILGVVVVVLGGLLFWISTRNLKTSDVLFNQGIIQTVGALVGMIPAGLVVLTSMALAVGVVRLSQSNTMVQELSCIEMLARVDTLCLDKTGTITDGTMSVLEVVELKKQKQNENFEKVISSILNALPPENATDKALYERFGDSAEFQTLEKIPFSSRRKYSAVMLDNKKTYLLGAPEFVLKEKYIMVKEKCEKSYRAGLRVLVLAQTAQKLSRDAEFNGEVEPVALIVLEDKIRSDAHDTINYFKNAGVDVKVISGDNPVSVSRIAQKVGITDAHKHISLDGYDKEKIEGIVSDYVVFGRVTPEQKKWIIQALKKNGKTVAMTGDGVNDLLALKEADTSITVASGSDAARNIANLVLLDSNFSSMPKVVKEGRRVINNIKKVATIFVTKTIFSIILTALSIILQLILGPGSFSYPISPSQLLIIDWFIVGIPSFFLAMEYNDIKVEKTKFLREVFKAALPGAISIVSSIIIFYGIKFAIGINDQRVVSTIIVYSALSIFMYVLFQNAKPFNLMRSLLVFTMYASIVAGLLFTPELFGLAPVLPIGYGSQRPLERTEILVLIIMVLLGYPVAYIITNIGRFIKSLDEKVKFKTNEKRNKKWLSGEKM